MCINERTDSNRILKNIRIRPSLKWFSERMEETLKKNDHKAHWSTSNNIYLFNRLKEEIEELAELIADKNLEHKDISKEDSKTREYYINECTDIANFAMMLADNAASNGD